MLPRTIAWRIEKSSEGVTCSGNCGAPAKPQKSGLIVFLLFDALSCFFYQRSYRLRGLNTFLIAVTSFHFSSVKLQLRFSGSLAGAKLMMLITWASSCDVIKKSAQTKLDIRTWDERTIDDRRLTDSLSRELVRAESPLAEASSDLPMPHSLVAPSLRSSHTCFVSYSGTEAHFRVTLGYDRTRYGGLFSLWYFTLIHNRPYFSDTITMRRTSWCKHEHAGKLRPEFPLFLYRFSSFHLHTPDGEDPSGVASHVTLPGTRLPLLCNTIWSTNNKFNWNVSCLEVAKKWLHSSSRHSPHSIDDIICQHLGV